MKGAKKASITWDMSIQESLLIRVFFSSLLLGVQQILLASVVALATDSLLSSLASPPQSPGGLEARIYSSYVTSLGGIVLFFFFVVCFLIRSLSHVRLHVTPYFS